MLRTICYKSVVTYSDNLRNVCVSVLVVIFITSFNQLHGYKNFLQWVQKVMSVGCNWSILTQFVCLFLSSFFESCCNEKNVLQMT